jgi:hypothetical protein
LRVAHTTVGQFARKLVEVRDICAQELDAIWGQETIFAERGRDDPSFAGSKGHGFRTPLYATGAVERDEKIESVRA